MFLRIIAFPICLYALQWFFVYKFLSTPSEQTSLAIELFVTSIFWSALVFVGWLFFAFEKGRNNQYLALLLTLPFIWFCVFVFLNPFIIEILFPENANRISESELGQDGYHFLIGALIVAFIGSFLFKREQG